MNDYKVRCRVRPSPPESNQLVPQLGLEGGPPTRGMVEPAAATKALSDYLYCLCNWNWSSMSTRHIPACCRVSKTAVGVTLHNCAIRIVSISLQAGNYKVFRTIFTLLLLLLWFRSRSLMFLHPFLHFVINFRGQKIHLLNYYQCLKSRVLSINKIFHMQNPKLVFAEFWRNTKLFARNIVWRFIKRVYPNHLFGYYTLVVRDKTICAFEVVSDAQHKDEICVTTF